MGVRIIRPQQRIHHIPGLGIQTVEALASVTASNWWEVAGKTCVAAYQPKGAASYAASLVNLANPGTYDAYEGVAPTWDAATGWGFNGTQWLTTGVALVNTYTLLIRFVQTNTGSIFGGLKVGASLGIWCGRGGNADFRYNSGFNPGVRFASGVAGIVGSGAATAQAYKDGAPYGAPGGTAWTDSPTTFCTIGGINWGGNPLTFPYAGTIQCASIHEALSAAEVATVSAAMAAL